MFQFYRQPFILIFLTTALGIFISKFFDLTIPSLVILLVAFLCFLFYKVRSRTSYFIFSFCFFFFFVGVKLFELSNPILNSKIVEIFNKEKIVCEIDVLDVSIKEGDWIKCIGKVNKIISNGMSYPCDFKLLMYVKNEEQNIKVGHRILSNATLLAIKNKGNPGEFDAEKYWFDQGIVNAMFLSSQDFQKIAYKKPNAFRSLTDYVFHYARNYFRDHFSEQNASLLSAIVLGDKSLLGDEIKAIFTNTGTSHILAVSGMHFGLLMIIFLGVFERFSKWITRKQAVIFMLLILWFYAILTGMSASVIRAIFMFSILFLAQLSNRNHDPINVLFFTAFVLIVINPMYLFDIGFQLSYLAMLGIYLFYQKIEAFFQIKYKWINYLWKGIAVGFAAQLLTTPISLFYFHQFPNYFIASNLVMMLTSGLILGLGIAILFFAKIPIVSHFIVLILSYLIFISFQALMFIDETSGAVAYGFNISLLHSICFVVIFILLFLENVRKSVKKYAVLSLVFLIVHVVYLRFESMCKSELCIYNLKAPMIGIKLKNQIHCYYVSKSAKVDKEVKQIIQNYRLMNPGEIYMHPIKNQAIKISNEKNRIVISSKQNELMLEVNGRHYQFVNFLNDVNLNNDQLIAMPWLEIQNAINLKDGAHVIALKD